MSKSSQITIAAGAPLSTRRFAIHEEVSSLFSVSVWARSEDDSIPMEPVVGKPASFRLESGYDQVTTGGVRLWKGICSHFQQLKAVNPQPGQRPLHTYYIRIVPDLWVLTQRRNHRIFQHVTIPDIVKKILGEWKIDADWQIDAGRYRRLEYKVQYGESDYTFISRLLEEAGIAFAFLDPEGGGAKLTFSDALESRPPRPPLPFTDNPNQAAEQEYAKNVRLSREVRPGAFTMRDYDYRRPDFELFGKAPSAGSPEDFYEQYVYDPGAFLIDDAKGGDTPVADDKGIARHDQGYGTASAERALLAERMGRKAVAFETNVMDTHPGAVFSIAGHPHGAVAGQPLLVTEFSIEGSHGGEWTMAARAVFTDAPFRPPARTRKPRAFGVQSAKVVGPKGEEIHTDEFGRVRVQFPWDREGKSDDGSSCWIRVSQLWAGTGFGMLMLPRIGQEVLVSFLDGDPDQPIIVGRTHNRIEPVPYKLPDDKTISTWKSDSSPRSDGYNEIKLEDLKGEELFYEQAEKNRRVLIKHNETITVLRDRQKQVGANETDTTGVNRFEVTGINRTETTGANRMTVIGGVRLKLIGMNEAEQTQGERRLRVGKDQHIRLRKRKREVIGEDVHLVVKGDRRELVTKDQSMMVIDSRHEKVEGRYALETGKAIHLRSAEILVGEAGEDVTIEGPGGFIRIDSGGVTIKGTMVYINEGGKKAGKGKGAKPEEPELPDASVDRKREDDGPVGQGGEAGAGSENGMPFDAQASATRAPSADEIAEIQNALDAGMHQDAIDLTTRHYGIDTSNVADGIRYDPTESAYGTASFDGTLKLGPSAMVSPALLASVIVHETTHANQAALMRANDPSLTGWPEDTTDYDEAMAYDAELRSAENTGLSSIPDEYGLAEERRDGHFDALSSEAQEQFNNGGYPPP